MKIERFIPPKINNFTHYAKIVLEFVRACPN